MKGSRKAPVPAPDEGWVLAVTGGRTLVGSSVLGALDRLAGLRKVLVLDVQPPDSADPRVVFRHLDLTGSGVDAEMAALLVEHGATVMLHAAFLWNPVRDWEWAHEVESVGTDYVLAAVQAAGVKRLVMTSTVMVYGAGLRIPAILTEDSPLSAPQTLPGFRDRVSAEQAVARFAEARPDVCTTVLRSALVLGPRVDSVVAGLLRLRPVPAFMGFDPMFQFLHPDDLRDAYLEVLVRDHPGVFNVAPPDAVSLSDVLRIGGRTSFPLPHPLVWAAVRTAWTSGLLDVHPTMLNLLRHSLIMDGNRFRSATGLEPRSTAATVSAFYGRMPQEDET
jgi:UDP-glucose 4-epimerase